MDDKLKVKMMENRARRRQNGIDSAVDGDTSSKPATREQVMDGKLKLKMMENRRRIEEEYKKNRARRRQNGIDSAVDGDNPSKPGNKRKAQFEPATIFWNQHGRIVFLFEFALGYALFDAHGVDQLPQDINSDNYLNNNNPFKLIAFYPFSSPHEALVQFKAILNSTVTKELKSFLVNNLPKRISGKPLGYQLGVSNGLLAISIGEAIHINVITGDLIYHVIRGLRLKLDKLIVSFKPSDLIKAQMALARSYRKQTSSCKQSSIQRIYHSFIAPHKVVVVPHKFQGLFIAKGLGKKGVLCTRNLLPGKVLYGDKLISIQNENDKTEVEYRVWNPSISKLAAAILSGLTNIWLKPGSRVLYLGDVCGITVLQLSDLVGSDGLVYVIGLSNDVANKVGERSNVITIPGNVDFDKDYRMVVGMVDVILGDIVYPEKDRHLQVNYIAMNARFYLRTGGHYLISTRPKDNNLTSQVKDPFDQDFLPFDIRMELKSNELVMLEPIGRGHAMAVGVYRMVK